jgi:hypothetical protein
MIDESLKRQIDRWLDDDLPETDESGLRRTLASDTEAIDFLCERALLHQALANSGAFVGEMPQSVRQAGTIEPRTEDRWRSVRGRFGRPWLWGTVTAAAIGLLILSMAFLPTVGANPARLVERTLAEYRETADRCYDVKIELGSAFRRGPFSRRQARFDSELWVRGDSFTQTYDSEGQSLVWGRDARGAVWFSVTADAVAIFEADEIPTALQELCDVRTLDLPTLLESLLRDCELRSVSGHRGISTILARPRAGSGAKFINAEIEIETDSLLVRSVTLQRGIDGRAVATTRFVLEQVTSVDDSMYDMRSHLRKDAEVLDGVTRLRRRAELFRAFLQRLRFSQAQPTPASQTPEESS